MPCSSVSRNATFSRTVSESNSALSWKTIPILPRKANRSLSRISLTSSPNTVMRPASGLSNPSTSLRIVLLPDPATPNSAFVSPTGSLNEIPRRTSVSSKASETSSNSTEKSVCSLPSGVDESRGKGGETIGSLVRKYVHQELRGEEVHHDNQHRRRDHGLCRRAPHTLRSPTRRHSIKTSYGRNDETEKQGLQESHED